MRQSDRLPADMISIEVPALRVYVSELLQAKGTPVHIARVVAESLVLSNQRGHDSHGFIRLAPYCDWIDNGWITPASEPEQVVDEAHVVQVDGHFGFGQYVGRVANGWAIEKARGGHCVLTIRRAAHLGRMGEFMEQAADAGLVCFSFTNTHGGGLVTAPHGGCERRLSANPLAAGAPLPDGPPMMMDIATSSVAAGKVQVAVARGESLAPGHLVDGAGQPSTDPRAYGDRSQETGTPGALLPFGGHKGYSLAMFCEVLAGALTGAGCSRMGVERVANGFLALFLDPAAFCGEDFYRAELGALIPHVKSSRLMAGHDEILYPGEPEARAEAERGEAVAIEPSTWERTANTARELGVTPPETRAA